MALNGMLKLVGEIQGLIRGSVTQKGREGRIKVMAADQMTGSDTDAASLQTKGRRQFTPFTIVKEVDLASIALHRALATNELLKEWELQLWRTSNAGAGAGVERNHFSIRLSDARVQQIRFVLPDTRDPVNVSRLDFEQIAFVYRKISWTWTDGNLVHEASVGAGTTPANKRRR